MKVGKLIEELMKLPQDLEVMAAGECAEKVVVETCKENSYVRIFQPWDMNVVLGSAGLADEE